MNRSEQIDKALKDILKDVDCAKANKQCDIDYFLSSIEKCAKAALALPPRQCDIGTADEQVKRFYAYCGRCDGGRCDHRIFKEDDMTECALTWAQMPAEEGGAK